MAVDFLTLPDELQSLANSLLAELERRGFNHTVEPNPLELPASPAALARRGHETHYFLVRQALSDEEIQKWVRYACSCTSDTRISICCPGDSQLPASKIVSLQQQGIGLLIRYTSTFQYSSEARDLAFHAQAPDRTSLKPKVRELLGEAFDRFERGDWRSAFEEACSVLEEECRRYLLKHLKMGRVKYQSGKKVKIPTAAEIKRMPLGALKETFCKMISQNQVEANLCTALTKLNPDRVRRTHHRRAKGAEAALRRRVGTHFWLISNALTELV